MISPRKLLAVGLLAIALPVAPVSAVTLSKEPLPRVEDRLCPGIIGMDVESALTVLDRIRTNALELGIRLGDPDTCTPNLLIGLVDDPGSTLERLMDESPRLFSDMTAPEKRRLRQQQGPARTFNVVRTKTRDGLSVTRRQGLVDIPETWMWSAHSRIYTPTRQDIVWTTVLLDAQQIGDATLKQVADYISMRAFASDFSAYREAGSDSILALFEEGAKRPPELTNADRAFLGTLYSGIANLPGIAKERQIENELGG
jgi:hypothetical protein